jgi:large subunit ribosomal protein L21|tara:strand:+ start:214 stop:528 length:315 start_codon:yes stop_codon:yes gene_type:complete
MYAVIKSGGKQYKVEKGDKLKVEKIDAEAGKDISIDDVLMLVDGENVTVGTPLIKGAKVSAKVESHGRGPKIKIIKFRRRKHHRKQMGHRQAYTELSITEIAAS